VKRADVRRSSTGFSVRLTGQQLLEYREGGRLMIFRSAELLKRGDVAHGIDEVPQWQPPHDKDPVTGEKIARIRRNIEADAILSGTRILWDESPKPVMEPPPGGGGVTCRTTGGRIDLAVTPATASVDAHILWARVGRDPSADIESQRLDCAHRRS
jgi:hypothetical protein